LKTIFKNSFFWIIIVLILLFIFNFFNINKNKIQKLPYSQFINKLYNGDIKNVIIDDRVIKVITNNEEVFFTLSPTKLDQIIIDDDWIKNLGITIQARAEEKHNILLKILINWMPMVLFVGIWIFFIRQMHGGSKNNLLSFSKNKAKLLKGKKLNIKFSDIAGTEEAKEEVLELVSFLKCPEKFYNLGAKIPSGVLLVGPPGTGKTLLAKAVAGEAGVPFFSISGSDFVEMFVGIGASRVRNMFAYAKKKIPCIVFIDEIDAVGRRRGSGLGGGHDEREQTLNQLLVEMDGFEINEGIIVVAATNRPDVLDPALLRSGRFDRQVLVDLPDLKGREEILKVHSKKIPLGDDVNFVMIARGVAGFSGADIANLVNESVLFAVKNNEKIVGMKHFEKAQDKMLMGVEKRSLSLTREDKILTAYHEAGHAIVGLYNNSTNFVYKVSITPRSRSLGVPLFLPEKDNSNYNLEQLESQIASLLGGRIAEEIIFGKKMITTGASNDIQKATDLSRKMVTEWGFSKKIGPLRIYENKEEVSLGNQASRDKIISDKTANIIDQEIYKIINKAYILATSIIKSHLHKLHLLVDGLLKYETISHDQIKEIIKNKHISK